MGQLAGLLETSLTEAVFQAVVGRELLSPLIPGILCYVGIHSELFVPPGKFRIDTNPFGLQF